MPPVRKSRQEPSTSSSATHREKFNARSKSKPYHRLKHDLNDESQSEESQMLGVQKLKSSLRQTRRLLAKENLAADVRVEAERRLRTLEDELQQAELRNRERAMAIRYHKIKFFERKKLMRKIRQIKKQLSEVDTKELRDKLYSARVDLNYILNFPKLEKYLSLFPNHEPTTVPLDTQMSADLLTKTDAKREEIREMIRSRMGKGELSAEPEEVVMKADSAVNNPNSLLTAGLLATVSRQGKNSSPSGGSTSEDEQDEQEFTGFN